MCVHQATQKRDLDRHQQLYMWAKDSLVQSVKVSLVRKVALSDISNLFREAKNSNVQNVNTKQIGKIT